MMKLGEAQKARANNPNLGFTRCATLERYGARRCATCAYRMYDKSPLNTPEAKQIGGGAWSGGCDMKLIPEVVGASGSISQSEAVTATPMTRTSNG